MHLVSDFKVGRSW